MTEGAGRGLTAPELALCVQELAPLVAGALVHDVALLLPGDDLLLVLHQPHGKVLLHVALGSRRARLVPTTRHFGRDDHLSGPQLDAVRRALVGSTLTGVEHAPGERRAVLRFGGSDGPLQLHVELFSARGLWALTDTSSRVLALSRPVETAVRTVRLHDRYAPPPARADAAAEPPPRFQAPVLAAVDAHFTALDGTAAAADERHRLLIAAERARTRAERRTEGLRQQLAEIERAPALRAEADLMLAYSHGVPRGAGAMTVTDPSSDEPRVIALDPAQPVVVQAKQRYDRARRLEEGRAIAAQRLQVAAHELELCTRCAQALAAPTPPTDAELQALRAELAALGIQATKPAGTALLRPTRSKPPSRTAGDNVRRFTSIEGYDILVGRDNQQNDRLTLRIANGNDLWLHVGGGRPGSHVVVRLPKGKTASLDTLLDAGHLAVHFSKARGERAIDVIYTFAKHVRKPKGLPSGAVVPAHTKTLAVRLDAARLQRVLDTAPQEPDNDRHGMDR